jgi:3-oxoacyl-[acyl-carrier protein] reductase
LSPNGQNSLSHQTKSEKMTVNSAGKKTPVALITGGSRGIGLGCAHALAKEGYALAINGLRDEGQIEDVIKTLRESGASDVIYCQGDIGQCETHDRILDRIRKHYGRLNLLVNNAGVAPKERVDVLKTKVESYEQVMNINLHGPFFLSQSVANYFIAQKQSDDNFHGCIININSISATVVSTRRGEYCVAKAGLAMITQLYAARLGEHEIPVYEIRPGLIKTDMTTGVTEKYDKLIEDGLCVSKRWGLPEDVGKAAAALARGDFLYSTGQVIMVDGGLTIPRL